ncbi:MAG: biotin--[acetyl-CoA-carboxylase] ligase [Planctomycetes bacterium]|nr:biotin--[acetyl-CoA-carboxylase] ligase [Planctomycetota bacterium]
MDWTDVERERKGARFGHRVLAYESLPSTNALAAQFIKDGDAADGLVIVADEQSAGRGTGSRTWHSPPGGLWFSLIIDRAPAGRPMTFWPALAIHRVLGERGLDLHLKWPNDVLVGKRKIAGVLIERLQSPAGQEFFVVGIGINLQNSRFPDDVADKAVTWPDLEAAPPQPAKVLVQVLDALENLTSATDLRHRFLTAWRMQGAMIRARRPSGEVQARVRGLSEEGFLLVTLLDGTEETWLSGSAVAIAPDYSPPSA